MIFGQCGIFILLIILLCSSWYNTVSSLSNNNVPTSDFRTSKVKFHVTYPNKTAVKTASISIQQTKSNFKFGCAINKRILGDKPYQNWFTSRFKFTSFTNEMKWYSTEIVQGHEDYTIADAMMKFSKDNGIAVRGHNILWDQPEMQPKWVHNLSVDELRKSAFNRINSVVNRYKGQVIHWDVLNENLHWSFYDDKFGPTTSEMFYAQAYEIDPNAIMFMNEFNTIEISRDVKASPLQYKKKMQEILSYPKCAGMKGGVGLEGHYGTGPPDMAHMKYTLDTLGTLGLPIWLTELDIKKEEPNQAKYLEQILRTAYAHPAVEGIIIFGSPSYIGFELALVDKDFKNTPVGDVVDKLIKEWGTSRHEIATNDEGRSSETVLSHGEYNVKIEHPVTKSPTFFNLTVAKNNHEGVIYLEIDP